LENISFILVQLFGKHVGLVQSARSRTGTQRMSDRFSVTEYFNLYKKKSNEDLIEC
jgi:hypothetical protein